MTCYSLNRLRFMSSPPSSIQRWKTPIHNGPVSGGMLKSTDEIWFGDAAKAAQKDVDAHRTLKVRKAKPDAEGRRSQLDA